MKCKICKKEHDKKAFCSQKCYWKSLCGIRGENAPNWKNVVGKSQVHKWLVVHFGNPKVCEGLECTKKATWFDWALKTGKQYERNRENFIRLCRSCHRRYDMTPEKRNQAINNLKKFNPYYGTERKIVGN